MAWNLAAYAISFSVLLTAGALLVLMWRANRVLQRWDRIAERLARQADGAMDAYVRLAEEARETAVSCRHTISGFSRLAEGARAMGDAAESAAFAAAHTAAYWHDRLTSMRGTEDGAAVGATGLIDYFRDLVRRVLTRLADGPASDDSSHPGASADPHSGE